METNDHKVFALKYRPVNFKELIGQDIMVQTITNSIKFKNLPNAYLLTGIRGVGKTTTARLIAKAINCKKNFIQEEKCNSQEYCHCKDINNSRHLDVLEMDAASRTGIGDIRELIESSKYNPTNAKYKIFIIDEVHMLSKQAFNGLLKTLEEPPPHLKFIFATTEVKKIPVTIVSRCQRFDLHRVPIKILMDNLSKISKIEKFKISENALKLIAKASEGSVRDSLSLLNRAFVSQFIAEKEIDETFIRKMLGIADRSKILKLLSLVFNGEQKKSIDLLREMINEGIEPSNFLNDLLEIIYFIQQKKSLGNFDSDLSISESEIEMIDMVSKSVSTSTLVLFWQFILKGLDELVLVSNPLLSLEMLIFRLLHLKEMPTYDDLINNTLSRTDTFDVSVKASNKTFNEETELSKTSKDQIKSTIQTKPDLTLLTPKETNMESIKSFEDLIEKLLEWTSKRWVITLAQGKSQKTFVETKTIKKNQQLEDEKKNDLYKKFKNIFPDAELVDILKKD